MGRGNIQRNGILRNAKLRKRIYLLCRRWRDSAVFAMLMLLFFLNTSRPYLLLVPVAGVVGGYFLFKLLYSKIQNKGNGWTLIFTIIFPILLGVIIAVIVIGLRAVLSTWGI